MKINTHDKAAEIIEKIENVLDRYDITVPSPEDEDREEDNTARIYGSIYSDLLDEVESLIICLLQDADANAEVIKYEFSGKW